MSLMVACGGALGVQHLELTHLRASLLECHDENNALEHSNQALTESIENQNAAYDLLQMQMDAKKKEAVLLRAQAEADITRKAVLIERLKTEKPSGYACADMHAALNRYFAGVRP